MGYAWAARAQCFNGPQGGPCQSIERLLRQRALQAGGSFGQRADEVLNVRQLFLGLALLDATGLAQVRERF